MKTKSLFFVVMAFALSFAACGTHQTSAYGDKKSVVIASEMDGVYVVRASGRSTIQDVRGISRTRAMDQAKKRAVYDITFTLLDCTNMQEKSLKPLMLGPNDKTKYEEYFDNFFATDGPWKNFAATAGTRYIATKFSKTNTDYVCTMSVIVDRKALKEQLKADGILK